MWACLCVCARAPFPSVALKRHRGPIVPKEGKSLHSEKEGGMNSSSDFSLSLFIHTAAEMAKLVKREGRMTAFAALLTAAARLSTPTRG